MIPSSHERARPGASTVAAGSRGSPPVRASRRASWSSASRALPARAVSRSTPATRASELLCSAAACTAFTDAQRARLVRNLAEVITQGQVSVVASEHRSQNCATGSLPANAWSRSCGKRWHRRRHRGGRRSPAVPPSDGASRRRSKWDAPKRCAAGSATNSWLTDGMTSSRRKRARHEEPIDFDLDRDAVRVRTWDPIPAGVDLLGPPDGLRIAEDHGVTFDRGPAPAVDLAGGDGHTGLRPGRDRCGPCGSRRW